jgi:RNA polymerase sigma factor for flagellar operon FliA
MAKELEIPLKSYYRLDQQVNDATLLSLEICPSRRNGLGANSGKMHGQRLSRSTQLRRGKDLVEKLASAVAELPERERIVVTLYYHEELTLREIGKILDLSEGRICQILAQGVAGLRGALGIKSRGDLSVRRTQAARKQSAKKPVRV